MSTLDAALLRALRASAVHLPRGELARLLRAEPGAIAHSITDLQAAGFEIDERPGLGVRLLSSPDRLIADDLRSRIGDLRFIRDIMVFEETDSTNERLLQLGQNGALGGLAFFAEHQSAGRGRFSRKWDSASHRGLWFSVLLRPELPLAHWPRLTTWAAVALADAIQIAASVETDIKWPNDLQHEHRKLAGILIETATDRKGQGFAVVGMGVNVNHEHEDFPADLRDTATSLCIASAKPVNRPALAAEVLRSLAKWYPFVRDDFESLLAEARRRSFLLGRRVALQTGTERIEGMAEDLADDGRLLLRMADGSIQAVGAGEASVIRQ